MSRTVKFVGSFITKIRRKKKRIVRQWSSIYNKINELEESLISSIKTLKRFTRVTFGGGSGKHEARRQRSPIKIFDIHKILYPLQCNNDVPKMGSIYMVKWKNFSDEIQWFYIQKAMVESGGVFFFKY